MSRRRSNVRQYSAEDQALTDISQEAESRLAAKRAARAEAREIRMKEIERQQKEAEEKERLGSDYGTRSRPQSVAGSTGSRRGSFESSEGTDSTSTRDLKMELRTLEEKYKGAMMTSAQLDNEKQSLVYQVELLKDQLEELTEGHTELQREYKDKNRDLEMTKRELQAAQLEVKSLHEQNDYKDRLIKESGLVIVAAEDGELALERSKESPSTNGPVGTGGLLLSSESLVLLNKGREGSLGMHSLDSSHSTTHTTQSAPSTGLSQPPSHTHAGELKSEGIAQTQSAESTASNREEGSSVDGPMFQGSPKDSETSMSSSHEAGDAEADVFAEAVDALSEQSGASVSQSPDGRDSENLAQEAGRTASASHDDVGSTSLGGQAVTEHVSEVAVEGMGSESTEKSTSDGMITPLHESEFCEDKGRKASDGAEGTEHTLETGPDSNVDQTDSGFDVSQNLPESKSGIECSQSDLPSVVITECSHSQRTKSQDSEEDEGDEFFDAVSTPLPSPMDTEFEFLETEKVSGGNNEVQVSETVSSDISEENVEDSKEVTEESGDQSVGEDGKEMAREAGKEVLEESGEQSVGEDSKEMAKEAGKEVIEESGEQSVGEDGKEEAVENPGEQMDEGSSKVSDGEASGEADESYKQEDGKEGDKEEGGVEAGEEGGQIEVEEEDAKLGGEDFMPTSGETGQTLAGDDKGEITEVCEKVCEEDIGKTFDEQKLQKDIENTDREGDEHGKQEIECKDTESDKTNSEMVKDQKQLESTNSDLCDDSKPENVVDTGGETVEEGGDNGGNEEETVEQIPESKKDDASLGACEVGEKTIENNENVSQQVHSHIDDSEESDEKREKLPSVEPSGNEPEDIQNSASGELDLDRNSERPAAVSEKDEKQTTPLSEGETDQSVPPESAEEKHDLDSTEDTVTISQETSSDPPLSEPATSEDGRRKDAEGAVKEGSGIENKEGEADQEDKSEESEEVPDTLSPIGSRKPVNRRFSEGGTSEDSEAQVHDDEYDFDDIDAVLDPDTTEASKDTGPGVGADSDDKVSFGSKDSGLQESFANKDSEANKEDAVSFGSRDSGLQESVSIKEKDSGSGDTVSMQSRDSGAGIEEIPSVQSQDGGNAPEAEQGAVGGESKSPVVTGSRESLDLEAKLDKMALAESGAKETTPSKDKHAHKKSKKFKMFKKIFK